MVSKLAIFLYTGNVCSSPTLQNIARFDDVSTPIFEHLDPYHLLEKKISREFHDITFNNALADVLANEQTALLTMLGIKLSYPARSCLAFKWRPFLNDKSALRRRMQLFSSMQVVSPFLIVRRSLLEQVTKIHLNELATGSQHLQFSAGEMTQIEYREYQQRLRERRFKLGSHDIDNIEALARRYLAGTKEIFVHAHEHFPGANLSLIKAEDFFQPEINEDKFFSYFSRKLHLGRHDGGEDSVHFLPKIRRAGFSLQNVSNYDLITSDPDLNSLEHQYNELLWDKGRIL